jgi:type I restriction enzyme, S subunit
VNIRLRHVLEINPPKSQLSAFPLDTEVTFAPMEALAEGIGGLDGSRVRLLGEVNAGSYSYFAENDVLLAKVTPCFENGKKGIALGLSNGVGLATSEVHVLRPNTHRLDTNYLRYLLCSEDFRRAGLASMTGSGGLRRVSDIAILDYRLPIEALAEQRKIADFLDREITCVNQLLDKKKKLGVLLQSRMDRIVDDATISNGPITKLKRHISLLPGYAFPSDEFSSRSDDIRLLRGINVGCGVVEWNDVAYWPKSLASRFIRFQLSEGDLVLGMDRPWISSGIRLAEITRNDLPCLLLQRVCKISPKGTLDARFLRLLLGSRRFLGYFEPILTGVSVPHISGSQIGMFEFEYLDLTSQVQRAAQADREMKTMLVLLSKLSASSTRLGELRSSLITAAVKGEIDVTNWRRRGGTERRLEMIEAEANA